jgi:hypothetical protein
VAEARRSHQCNWLVLTQQTVRAIITYILLILLGTSIPSHPLFHDREVDSATVKASVLIADRVESLVNEGGDYIIAKNEYVLMPLIRFCCHFFSRGSADPQVNVC